MSKQHDAPASEEKTLTENHLPELRTSFTVAVPPAVGLIDESQLLALLPISRRNVFSLAQAGKIPVIRLGRRKIYHWPSVEAALLREQKGGA